MSSSKKWKAIVVALLLAVGAFIITAAREFVPERSAAASISASDDDGHPLLSVPTVGKIVRYNRDAPRYFTIWAGRVDLARMAAWQAQVSEHASGAMESELSGPWHTEVAAILPPDLRDAPFVVEGDFIQVWRAIRGMKLYTLTVNMTTGGFQLVRTVYDE